MKSRAQLVLLGVMLAGSVALGQAGETEKRDGAKKETASNPLAGPTVTSRAEGALSIVQRDSTGMVVRVETSPAEAALGKLSLDGESRRATSDILRARAKAFDRLMADHLTEIAAASEAFQSGKTVEGVEQIRKIMDASPELKKRGMLVQEFSAVLPEAQGRELRAMVQEYMQALIAEEAEIAKNAGRKPNPGKVIGAEFLRSLGQEIKAAYDRGLGQIAADFDKTLKSLNVTPEQESKIRGIVQNNLPVGKPATQAQKNKTFVEVMMVLDADQRRRAVEMLK